MLNHGRRIASLTRRALIGMVLVVVCSSFAQPLDMEKLKGLKFRSIGPAGMSGRVTAIDVVRRNPNIIYVGSASGGLWKSESGGIRWAPIFDTLAVASIGAIAVDQRTPDVVWVGTGEGNPRNSQTNGNGVYKSMDGGKTWKHLGLDRSRNIHRVLLDPFNPQIAYVAALGAAWGENPERGVFKTTDGGLSWHKVLTVNEKVGCADLVMDPTNPHKLFAAMWEYRRWPWFFNSGGQGSGLYVTFDGGKSWKRLTEKEGLPKGHIGRIGLAIAPSNPNRVYALIESQKNALYRSDDGGFTWRKISDTNIGNRPFYYCEIVVDPRNDDRLYNLYTEVSVSIDAGKTFETFIGWNTVHGDHHALYIHPDNPSFMINGNDGGVAISHDRGGTWRFIENLPLGQFYHINVDMEMPYNVYGGLQDNGSWRGPAYAYHWGGIVNAEWENVGWGDGFDVVPDRSNPRSCYSMWQGGNLVRVDIATGDAKYIRPAHPEGVKLRFNWNAGIAHDPFNPTTIYFGSQFLHKSTDRGDTWTIISPDLTTNDTSKQKQLESGGLTYDVTTAENHCTIIAIAPSPVGQGVLWVGTDDGNLHVTTNGGSSWTNVVKNVKGVPDSTWIPQIHASAYNAAEAFVVFDNHRRNDWTPYLFRTTNFGATWERLADEKQVWGFALSFVQDPVEPKLMFLGTEFGLYVSIDGGKVWTRWKYNYPTVSTTDLILHPREHDLVVGTFGRAVYVLDDVVPLREIARRGAALLTKPLHLFPIPDAVQVWYKPRAGGMFFPGDAAFSGDNRPPGARISLLVNPLDTNRTAGAHQRKESVKRSPTPDTVTIEVLNAAKETLRTLRVKVEKGINRMQWNLDRKVERMPSQPKPEPGAPEPGGWGVPPGTYMVRVSYGEYRDSAMVNVTLDHRVPYTAADIQARTEMLEKLYAKIRIATDAADKLRDTKRRIEQLAGFVKDRNDSAAQRVKDLGNAMQDSIKKLNELFVDKEVQGWRWDPDVLQSKLNQALGYANSAWYAPTETQRIVYHQVIEQMKRVADAVNAFFEKEFPKYQAAVDAAHIRFFEPYTPIRVEK